MSNSHPYKNTRTGYIIFVRLLFLLFTLAFALPLAAEPTIADPGHDAQWRALLHSDASGKSAVDSAGFFLSPAGKYDPLAEYEASVALFRSDPQAFFCKYPARAEWLQRHHLGVQHVTITSCPELLDWFSAINPQKLTLIFASAFMNNPASAFGHTFLRFDEETAPPFLAYAANFAAATSGEDAFTYAVKGIFGGYGGYFSVAPYYEKVKLYSDLESRDIWEYRLQFTPEEVRRIVLHLWELEGVALDYYYFDENCSYQILSLLDVARPSLNLKERMKLWVIPVDTVRALEELISSAVFRPATGTLLNHRLKFTDGREEAAANKILQSGKTEGGETAAVLDLAYDLLTYRKVAGVIAEESSKDLSLEILRARGRHGRSQTVPELSTPEVRPEDGHPTGRLLTGASRVAGESRMLAGFRPAFHGLEDPLSGYQHGAEIEFFDTRFSLPESRSPRLEELDILKITSLTSVTAYDSPLSWSLGVELGRERTRAKADSLLTSMGGSAGYTAGNERLSVSALLDSELQFSSDLQSGYRIGLGPRFILLANLSSGVVLKSDTKVHDASDSNGLRSDLTMTFPLTTRVALSPFVQVVRRYERTDTVYGFELLYYFNP